MSSPMQVAVLRVLSLRPMGDVRLVAELPDDQPESKRLTIDRMHEAGLIKKSGRIWHITTKGKGALPKFELAPLTSIYQPPKVYRRPGSDHSGIPSHYGDAR